MSLFKGMAEATASRDTEWIRPGSYLCYIREFTAKTNRKGIPMVVVGFTVVDVLSADYATRVNQTPHKSGDMISWGMHLTKDATKPALKRALMTITGVPEAKITDAFCDQLAGSTQPLRGFFVVLDAQQIQTKKGSPFTLVSIKRRVSKEELHAHAAWMQIIGNLKLSADAA